MLVSASDPVAAALSTALDGLALRQRVAANNVANIDTPGFTAATLDFEGNLRAALADGSLDENGVIPTVGTSTAQAGANGNNRQDVINQLFATKDRPSVLGTYSINKDGDTSVTDYGLYKVKNGQIVFSRVIKPQGV